MEEENTLTTMTKERRSVKYDNPFFQSIYSNVWLKKRNAMVVVCGAVGTGKSYIALRIAEALDPTFNAENLSDRLVLSPEQFMKMITRKDNKLKTGAAVIIDEASTQMYNRQWASVNNQMINYILTTFRHRRLICIMTTPHLDFLDSNVRRLFDYFVESQKVDFKSKQSKAKVYQLSYNKLKADKPYRKYFRIRREGGIGSKVSINDFWFDKPSDELCERYEEYAGEFKNKIAREALEKAMTLKNKEEKKELDINEIAEKIIKNKKRYFKIRGGKPYADRVLIEIDFSVGSSIANRIKKISEKKVAEKDIINI